MYIVYCLLFIGTLFSLGEPLAHAEVYYTRRPALSETVGLIHRLSVLKFRKVGHSLEPDPSIIRIFR